MIYMVDHVFTDTALEPAWHEWYSGYLKKLISVPGIHTAQRFRALGCTPSRFLAMYSIESADVYTSDAYKGIGGGGSQSVRFHHAYQAWQRNLLEGLDRVPAVKEGQRVIVLDCRERSAENPLGPSALWLKAVGLHMTTPYRSLVVLAAAEAATFKREAGSYLYEPFTAPLLAP